MQNRLPYDTPVGWLARAVGAVVGAIVMVGLFFLGLTVFAAVAGLALLVFLVMAARIWWLRRRYQRAAGRPGSTGRPGREAGGVTLEGEYEERHGRD